MIVILLCNCLRLQFNYAKIKKKTFPKEITVKFNYYKLKLNVEHKELQPFAQRSKALKYYCVEEAKKEAFHTRFIVIMSGAAIKFLHKAIKTF
jgi:thioredoxin reductase